MPEQELKQQSQTLLSALGESLAKAFGGGVADDDAISAMLERLDEVSIPREIALDSACERTTRLLSNTANQVAI